MVSPYDDVVAFTMDFGTIEDLFDMPCMAAWTVKKLMQQK